MNKHHQQQLAEHFHKLHFGEDVLLLPNAWDALSAKVYEVEGFKAIATTSAGIANTLGFPDVQKMKIEDNLAVVNRICNSVDIPVSVDIEAGYTNDLNTLKLNTLKIIASGAVGINLEDSPGFERTPLMEISFQQEKISAIRKAANDNGLNLFINARIDTWMFLNIPKEEKIAECLERAEAYLNAGADSIFIPDLEDMDEVTISGLIKGIKAPLNIIAGKNSPPISRLKELGVKRVTFGPRPQRALVSLLKEISKELLDEGTCFKMCNTSVTYSEINGWFTKK